MPTKRMKKAALMLCSLLAVLAVAGGALAQGIPDQITLQTTDFFVSAIAYDAARDRFLVAGGGDGTVYALEADGSLTAVVVSEQPNIIGMEVDPASDSLALLVSDQAGMGGMFGGMGGGMPGNGQQPPTDGQAPAGGQQPPANGQAPADGQAPQPPADGQLPEGMTLPEDFNPSMWVVVYSLANGSLLRSADLTGVVADGTHLGSDLALDASGNVYVADRIGGVIYMVDAAGSVYYMQNATLSGMGLNGIGYVNGALLVQSMQGGLYKVPLDNPDNVTQVTLPETLTSLRDIVVDAAGNVVALTGGMDQTPAAVVLTSADGWATASVVNQVELTGMATTGVLRGSDLYVVLGGFGGRGMGGNGGNPPANTDGSAPSGEAPQREPSQVVKVSLGA